MLNHVLAKSELALLYYRQNIDIFYRGTQFIDCSTGEFHTSHVIALPNMLRVVFEQACLSGLVLSQRQASPFDTNVLETHLDEGALMSVRYLTNCHHGV